MMQSARHITPLAALALAACAPQGETVSRAAQPFMPEYLGIETALLDGDLVDFTLRMTGARDEQDVADYGDCAAARYALIRGYGFARHVRTNIENSGNVWTGDAVYVISDALPEGLRTIDAEVTTAACNENGIPTI
ncbi:MAG: hypothetical protein P8X50_14070 [Maritimibacter sp.]|jgi:hypothetical protein